MGLGKITRVGGKVATALQVGMLLIDLGGALVRRIRGKSTQLVPDGTTGVDQADDQRGGQQGADHDHLQL